MRSIQIGWDQCKLNGRDQFQCLSSQTPGIGQVFPVKVELVEDDCVKHLNFGKESPVSRQLAPAGRAAKEREAQFFFPVRKLLEYTLNISFGFFGVTSEILLDQAKKTVQKRMYFGFSPSTLLSEWKLYLWSFMTTTSTSFFLQRGPCMCNINFFFKVDLKLYVSFFPLRCWVKASLQSSGMW